MARRKTRTLTEVELEIMRVVWEKDETTVEEIRETLQRKGRTLAPSSIRKMLSILQDKGYVTRKPTSGRAFLYRAQVKSPQAHKRILKDIMQRAFDGSASTLVAALVNADMVSGAELAAIKRLISRREREGKK